MRDAVDLRRLVPRADGDPDADRHGLDRVHAVGEDAHAVFEGGEAHGHVLATSCGAARPGSRTISARPRQARWAATCDALGPAHQLGEPRRQRGAEAHGALDRVGEFRRDARVASATIGTSGSRPQRLGRGDRDRAVRVEQLAGGAAGACDRRPGSAVIVDPVRGEEAARLLPQRAARRQGAGLAERARTPRRPRRRRRAQLEIEPLEIARDLDVHARAEARLDRAEVMRAGLEEARQDVVAVGGDDQLGRSAGPCGGRRARHRHCRNCRSARRSRPRARARRAPRAAAT